MEPTRTLPVRPLSILDRIVRIVVVAVLLTGLFGLVRYMVSGPAPEEATTTQE